MFNQRSLLMWCFLGEQRVLLLIPAALSETPVIFIIFEIGSSRRRMSCIRINLPVWTSSPVTLAGSLQNRSSLAEWEQSLLVKANLLSPLEQEKSALLHNSVQPLLKPRLCHEPH